MKPILTATQSAALDEASAESIEVLMERAGLRVALAAADMGVGYGSRVIVLAGPGNNGGDGYVAARYLRDRGVAVGVQALAEPRSRGAKWAAKSAADAGVPIRPLDEPIGADLVIDALFGSGFRGSLPAEAVTWAKLSRRVLAVDVPSGLNATDGTTAGSAFRAERTITFQTANVGHYVGVGPEVCGRVEIADIGLPDGEYDLALCEELDAPIPQRTRIAHKWSAGSVAVVGGAPGMTGAALLAAWSALASGAGSVAIACRSDTQQVYSAAAPGLLTHGFGTGGTPTAQDAIEVLDYASRFDSLVIGPGLGPDAEGFVRVMLERWAGPLVLDADGINALSGIDLLCERSAPTIITPHAGEFQRLTGHAAAYLEAAALARETGATVLLKGNPTFIAGTAVWMVATGGRELASIGTGDVLAGIVGAFAASGLSDEVAARSAAYWHGVTGSKLANRENVTATELASEVGRVIR
jgi:NAD(P)H-hydrate epimerase